MPDATELCSLAALKSYLSITSSGQDTLLQAIKDGAEKAIKNYLGRDLLVATYTEYYDGDGSATLRVDQRPITEVTSVYADPARLFASASLIPSSDIIDDDKNDRLGIIQLFQYRFLKGPKSIKVVYNAGYSSIPADITQAVKMICAREFTVQNKAMFAQSVQRVGDMDIVLSVDSWPKLAVELLDRYRRMDF